MQSSTYYLRSHPTRICRHCRYRPSSGFFLMFRRHGRCFAKILASGVFCGLMASYDSRIAVYNVLPKVWLDIVGHTYLPSVSEYKVPAFSASQNSDESNRRTKIAPSFNQSTMMMMMVAASVMTMMTVTGRTTILDSRKKAEVPFRIGTFRF